MDVMIPKPTLPALDPQPNYVDVDAPGYFYALAQIRDEKRAIVAVDRIANARYRIHFQAGQPQPKQDQ